MWAGTSRRRARSSRLGVPPRRRRGAPAVRLRGDARSTPSGSRPPGSSRPRSSPRSRRRCARTPPSGVVDESDEDVHSAIERLLGDVGRKIHAGRSRNDQVAAAFRLYVADACAEADAAIVALRAQCCSSSPSAEADTPLPGYTHLQRAQPVTVGHHLLAWVEMLERDRARFAFAARRRQRRRRSARARSPARRSPLPPPPGAMRNSLDAVADRDFALDYLYAVAVLFGHLSRIGEELCLWSSAEFGFATLPEAAATGSSMMPQKLNPDVAELARGKAGTAIGRLTGLLAVVKGLPLAYDRDLQEDKPPVFAARRDVAGALGALGVLVGGLELDRDRLAAAAADPAALATDAAEALVRSRRPVPRRARGGRGAGARRHVRAAGTRPPAPHPALAASSPPSPPPARGGSL